MGSLNASHASATALAHASPKSVVGQLAAYRSAIDALNAAPPHSAAARQALSDAALAISRASNKAVTPATVQAVNTNLGLTVTHVNVNTIATLAAQEGRAR